MERWQILSLVTVVILITLAVWYFGMLSMSEEHASNASLITNIRRGANQEHVVGGWK